MNNENVEQFTNSGKYLTKLYTILWVTLASAVILIATSVLQSNATGELKGETKSAVKKMDTVITSQANIEQGLNQINNKIESSTQRIIDSLSSVAGRLNKVNQSVLKVGKNVDTLIVYIKK